MGVPVLKYSDAHTIMANLLAQAKGGPLQEVNNENFVACGEQVLKCGYNATLQALSVVLSDTYFSIRPYTAKLKAIEVTNEKFGYMSRKVTAIDKDPIKNEEYNIENGAGVDQYAINKTDVLELHFYGGNTYARDLLIYKNQLDTAFRNEQEFLNFYTMLYQNLSDMVEQDKETAARDCITNMIAGRIATAEVDKKAPECVDYLIDGYNAYCNGKYDETTIKSPEVRNDFVKWLWGHLGEVSNAMTDRSNMYHTNITGKTVTRHTPKPDQVVYLLASEIFPVMSSVFTSFNKEFLDTVDYEMVNYWQAKEKPDQINVVPSYLDPSTGNQKVRAAAVAKKGVFGIMADRESMGYTIINTWSETTPMNARAGYAVRWEHYTTRWINDFTENCVVFILGKKPEAA